MKLFVLLLSILSVSSSSEEFRADYVYNKKTNAFYKLHNEQATNMRAKQMCTLEGAGLMVPKSDVDVSMVHGMLKQYPDIGDYVWLGNDGLPHESAEENPMIDLESDTDFFIRSVSNPSICEVMTRAGETETYHCFREFPFVCKVEARDIIYDSHCQTYSKGYKYYHSIGSCYKIPWVALAWNHAYDSCRSEGSHLVVLNSEAESHLIKNITHSALSVYGARTSWFFFAGIRAEKTNPPIVFKTIFNQTLEEAGFNQWSPNEPNNALSEEYCGSIFKNDGKYNDINCWHLFGFICEKEIKHDY